MGGRNGAHGFVPVGGVATLKADDDIHGLGQDTKLVDPGLMAIENQQPVIAVRRGHKNLSDCSPVVGMRVAWKS
jgi:hypothetical protein